ncbi:MAG: hypothetical protein GY698_18315 [Actinomycetia bacterium]|nr:hypothetical protein [Actinomycetes bacterium]
MEVDWEQPVLRWLRWSFALIVFALAAGAFLLVLWMLVTSVWSLVS